MRADESNPGCRGQQSPVFQHGGWLALLFVLLVLLPGQCTLPVVDRDEARFAQASRQMLESGSLGGWVVPRVQERLRLNKPPLVYWLQAGSTALCTGGEPGDDAVWMYRLPSALCAAGTVLLTWQLGRRMFDARAGLLAGLLMAASPMLIWDAHQARSDQLLVCVTTAAMVLLWRLWEQRDAERLPLGQCAAFWLLVGVGIMSKGPITPLVALLAAVSLAFVGRRGEWLLRLRPGLGVLLLAAVVAPWAVLVGESVGWERYLSILSDEVLQRAASAKEGHAGPPGYHLVLLAVLFWPGSLLAVAAVQHAARGALRFDGESHSAGGRLLRLRRAWRARRIADERLLFLLAWLLPAWVVFECASTKLPHYTLPLYPALALLAGRLLTQRGVQTLPLHRLGCTIWIVIGAGMIAALQVGLFVGLSSSAFNREAGESAAALPVLSDLDIGVCIAGAGAALFCLARGALDSFRGRLLWAQMWGLGCTIGVLAPALGLVLPAAEFIWITPRLVAAVDALDPAGGLPLAAVGYREDSLIFSTHGRVERLGRGRLSDWLADRDRAVVIAPPEVVAEQPGLAPRAAVEGFNYSNGKHVRLLVCTTDPLEGSHSKHPPVP